jgi:hypothetical protein
MIGPFLRWTPRMVVFVVLTIITQVGGLCYALALFSRSRLFPATKRPIAVSALLFTAVYAVAWAPIGWFSSLSGSNCAALLCQGKRDTVGFTNHLRFASALRAP